MSTHVSILQCTFDHCNESTATVATAAAVATVATVATVGLLPSCAASVETVDWHSFIANFRGPNAIFPVECPGFEHLFRCGFTVL